MNHFGGKPGDRPFPSGAHAAALTLLVRRLRRAHPRVWEHSIRVGAIMGTLTRQAAQLQEGLAFDRRLAVMAGMLHDIGKIKVPKALLEKPQHLTVREHAVLEQHVRAGADLLAALPATPRLVMDAVLYHHERADGSGYPRGLGHDAIPAIARLCAVADTMDAMTATDRPYRLPRTSSQAVAALLRAGPALFDPSTVALLRRTRLSELDQLRNVDQARKMVQDVLTELETGDPPLETP